MSCSGSLWFNPGWYLTAVISHTRPPTIFSKTAFWWTSINDNNGEWSLQNHCGRVSFDQNFQFKIEWNRKFLENRFENFGSPLEVVLFFGNLEIPEISCSIWHFYPVWICPSSFSREKLQRVFRIRVLDWLFASTIIQFGACPTSSESTLHWTQNNVPQFSLFLIAYFPR